MTARYDWTINQGETSTLTVTREDSEGGPLAFTGTFRGAAKDKYGGTQYLEIEDADVEIDPNSAGSHVIEISLSAAKTAAMAAGKYVYDLENVNGDTVARILEGSLIVKPEVTT